MAGPYVPGPFSAAHLYLQWGGKLPGNEQWSCGMRMINKGPGALGDEAAMLAGAAAAVVAFHQRANTAIGNNALLSFVKLNGLDVNGHYVAAGTTEATYADLPGGAAGAGSFPNQVANVVTLTTGYSRGPAHKGRIYLPLPYFALGVGGTITAAAAIAVSGSMDTFLTDLNAVSATKWEVGVMSRKLGTPGARRVTGNLVGRVLDTQRRRRRSLVEDYQ